MALPSIPPSGLAGNGMFETLTQAFRSAFSHAQENNEIILRNGGMSGRLLGPDGRSIVGHSVEELIRGLGGENDIEYYLSIWNQRKMEFQGEVGMVEDDSWRPQARLAGRIPVCTAYTPALSASTVRRKCRRGNQTTVHEAVSIYDAGGVYARIESAWSSLVCRRHVCVNSGTSALLSMYFGLDMEPKSEVIVPAYNFFAAATPLFALGMRPVLAECDADGNLDVHRLEACIGPATAAVCVTHLWGFPRRLDELKDICERRGIALLEDASHAHGAQFAGLPVGSFGAAAAWSLQAKKILAAGEGGFSYR